MLRFDFPLPSHRGQWVPPCIIHSHSQPHSLTHTHTLAHTHSLAHTLTSSQNVCVAIANRNVTTVNVGYRLSPRDAREEIVISSGDDGGDDGEYEYVSVSDGVAPMR